MTTPGEPDPVSEAVVRDAARAGDLDRYLAALLSPRAVRGDLLALTAFVGEIARIPHAVTEPMMGEIRLQWWRDALSPAQAGEATGSPVADALEETIVRHGLPRDELVAIIDAHARELDPQSLATELDLEDYLQGSDGAAFRLAARILGVADADVDRLTAAAAQAYGRARLLRSLPSLARHGSALTMTATLGRDRTGGPGSVIDSTRWWLEQARDLAPSAPRAVLPALLPVALVEPYLAALEGLGHDIVRVRADISPLTRVWRLWRASMLGRF